MLAFDATLTRLAGVLLLLGGAALGVFTVATPEFLAMPDDSENQSR